MHDLIIESNKQYYTLFIDNLTSMLMFHRSKKKIVNSVLKNEKSKSDD